MPFSPSDSRLFGGLFATPEVAAFFSDEAYVRQLVRVEAALAKAQSRLGLISSDAAAAIGVACDNFQPDWDKLKHGTDLDGFPVVELVAQLRKAAGSAASYVHWGATTQDIMDTALVLQVVNAGELLQQRLMELTGYLAQLAVKHRHTLMCGRTHSQQALPISFGVQVASWLAPLLRHKKRWLELRPRIEVLQLGGAVGTLASMGEQGLAVQAALADELGMSNPAMSWHTQRDGLAELAGWLSLISGSLGKMAQDIILLAQSEVGEVRESSDPARGGSSTMPQKSNPIQSELIVAAARQNAGLLASMHQAQIAEHQRATHGWQLEWLALPQMFALTAAALDKSIFLSTNLVVDAERMRANVKATNGLMMAEALNFALAEHMDRVAAKQLIREAVEVALREGRHLLEVVRTRTSWPLQWEALREENYLGASDWLIDRVLAQTDEVLTISSGGGVE